MESTPWGNDAHGDHSHPHRGLRNGPRRNRSDYQETPGGLPAERDGSAVLEYDTPGNTALVGINDEATRAVFYHERDRYVIGVDFGMEGLADGGPVLAEFGEKFGTNVYGWVRRMEYYWSWVNPRYW